ncbi:MAG: hypothetical protein HY432_01790 [Candidatus Liptonbacteria bacterium]|nr:hypothetical protein [Candidatus Liptonbacteria bacterium]
MNNESKICQNCKQNFVIEPEDFDFYKKIDVPPPTWCPECRLQRRLLFMNERTFYKRDCDKCGKNVISMFPAGSHKKVYCSPCWWSDDWGAEEYAHDYDFSKTFFRQFAELYAEVPEMARIVNESSLVRSDYSNISGYLKDCYLVLNSDYCEECSYCEFLEQSKSCLDVTHALSCEKCYNAINCYKCYGSTNLFNCDECVNVHFSRGLSGCSDCFGCIGLKGKKYYFFNEPLTEEEYKKKFAEWNEGSYSRRVEIEKKLAETALNYPYRYMTQSRNSNVTGDFIFWSKNVFNSYEVISTEDSRFCHFLTFPVKTADSYDFTMWGGGVERTYECMATGGGQRDVRFCFMSWSQSLNLEYCWYVSNTRNANLFGCVGLRNKEYCILNKQYTKEEYEKLVPRIIEHMNSMPYTDAKGRIYKYGEFFPPELSPFSYNEAFVQGYFPLTKKQAEECGYKWKEPELRNYRITVTADQLPNGIKDVKDDILEQVIGCLHERKCDEQCTEAFKIIPSELEFYRAMKIPLPRLCPNCRHRQRIKKRNPIKLWHGKCQCVGSTQTNTDSTRNNADTPRYRNATPHFHGDNPCPNEFETSYSPERSEIIYCEQCYNSEVA